MCSCRGLCWFRPLRGAFGRVMGGSRLASISPGNHRPLEVVVLYRWMLRPRKEQNGTGRGKRRASHCPRPRRGPWPSAPPSLHKTGEVLARNHERQRSAAIGPVRPHPVRRIPALVVAAHVLVVRRAPARQGRADLQPFVCMWSRLILDSRQWYHET